MATEYLFPTATRPTLGLAPPLIQCVSRFPPPLRGVKWPARQHGHPVPCIVEVRADLCIHSPNVPAWHAKICWMHLLPHVTWIPCDCLVERHWLGKTVKWISTHVAKQLLKILWDVNFFYCKVSGLDGGVRWNWCVPNFHNMNSVRLIKTVCTDALPTSCCMGAQWYILREV